MSNLVYVLNRKDSVLFEDICENYPNMLCEVWSYYKFSGNIFEQLIAHYFGVRSTFVDSCG
jgi:hypothetical protein